jgi:hypothetical protein
MKPVVAQPKQRSGPDAKDELKSLSPPEVQKKLGSSREGLRKDEA